ncbi:uncharacterized protein Dyak_GE27385 [Drosophila yakuba]|uniref:Uncharacterized protein n=1 Tax=Drosophila yakuba TaxID=7245 RepID=A0A0R1E2Z6_DROYA|nr:uncharacterized protein Dyak_GE27385 [Drosophila yakuba]
MSTLRCLVAIIFGVLFVGVAVAENNKSQDGKDERYSQPDEVKSSDEPIERIRRQIGAFGIHSGFYGGRPVGAIGSPYYGASYGNPFFVPPYGLYFHDRRFGANYGSGGRFYGR